MRAQLKLSLAYEGDDYPAYYPLELDRVILIPEETVHYRIYADNSTEEWESVIPPGGGFVNLGPQGRPFGLSIYHQHHCLMRLRESAIEGKASGHVFHCLNYLRQMVLCEADTTLEPVVPVPDNPWAEYIGVPHVCKDWTGVYQLAAEDYKRKLRKGSRSTTERDISYDV